MKVLITGATGFIGNHLARRLAKEADVRCLVRRNSDRSQLDQYNVELAEGDILDRRSLKAAFRDVDVVYHLAGAIMGLSKKDFQRANVYGCRNIVQEAAKQSNPPRIIYTSSMAAGGPATIAGPRREFEAPAPVSAYGRSKLHGEYEFQRMASKAPTTVVRPSVVYGEGDRSTLEFFKPILQGRNFVLGDPDWPISLIEVRDLVDLLISAANGEQVSKDAQTHGIGRYYAAGSEAPTLAAFGGLLAEALGIKPPKTIKVPRLVTKTLGAMSSITAQITRRPSIMSFDKTRELTKGPWHVSNEKARGQLSFQPRITLQHGLENAVDWYRRHEWL